VHAYEISCGRCEMIDRPMPKFRPSLSILRKVVNHLLFALGRVLRQEVLRFLVEDVDRTRCDFLRKNSRRAKSRAELAAIGVVLELRHVDHRTDAAIADDVGDQGAGAEARAASRRAVPPKTGILIPSDSPSRRQA
jgi:hypothetical protein